MISEAKRICDSLVCFPGEPKASFDVFFKLANPLQLINSPPPALYTSFGVQPVFGTPGYPAQMPAQAFSATPFAANPYAPQTASTSQENNTPAPVLPNQPQPFVMPLGPPPIAAPPTYTVYPPRYPATSYYQYPASAPGFYTAAPTQNTSQPASTPTNTTANTTPPTNPTNPPPAATPTNAATTTPTMTHTNVPTNPNTGTPTQAHTSPWPTGYNQVGMQSNGAPHLLCSRYPKGQWAEDEVTRLKQLTEQCKDQKGEIDWERVTHAWGNTRTR